MIGEPPDALVDKVGAVQNVHFAGFMDPEELETHYRRCDLFAMSGTGEGFGIVFLEAMMYEPVVAENQDSSAESVEDDRSGRIVVPDRGDIEALAAAVLDLLDDPVRPAAFGAAGRDRTLRDFTMSRFREGFRFLVEYVGI